MIFKNKALKTTAAAIAIFSMVATGSVNYVHADSYISNEGISIERSLVDDIYDVNYDVIYIKDGQDKSNHIKAHMQGVKVKVENGKIYLVVEYKASSHAIMDEHKFIVDGKEVQYKNEGSSYTIELNSVNSKVEASMKVNIPGVAAHSSAMAFQIVPQFDVKQVIKDDTYPVKNSVSYIGSGDATIGNNMARQVLEENSTIEVKNGEIKTTLTFSESMYTFLGDFKVKVDNESVDVEVNKANRTISFAIPSIDSKVVVSVNVTMMGREVSFSTEFDKTNIKYEEIIVSKPSNGSEDNSGTGGNTGGSTGSEDNSGTGGNTGGSTGSEDNSGTGGNTGGSTGSEDNSGTGGNTGGSTGSEDNSGTNGNTGGSIGSETTGTIKDGTYTVKNTVSYVGTGNSELGNSMARQVLEENSKIEVVNGKIKVTLGFTEAQYSFLDNFRVSVDGKNVSLDVNKQNRTISFEIPSIDSEVLVSVNVTAMGRDVSFKTTFDKSTLVFGDNTTNNGNSTTTNNGTTTNTDTNTDETTATVKKGKLYTIQNTVSHSSQTGKEMARKYLSSTSKVEIVDGETYVTLTFTGSSYMKNHAIYVNGSKVSHTVVSKSGDSISLRFKVSELSDSIKVGMYVIPMSRDIEFGVTLLEDTLTFVKDFDLNEDGTLPQTGSALDSSMMIGAGSTMILAAGILGRRKRK
ncbi:NEAT domain-containing protein [Romboutsia sp. Marseille-P6047]|uniref:NEAT domain-containing protein n=1 Tax=Romboutsia sp. Marseille-P6047 TaxID=2161817 RepID=UPI000F05B1D6|nr:NEAT domain-containing protein [Romboutsia sp. Marseille-P6047]